MKSEIRNDTDIKSGDRYQHYKGNLYEVLEVATHTETLEKFIIYRSVNNPEKVWARPLEMFCDEVEVESGAAPRFSRIS